MEGTIDVREMGGARGGREAPMGSGRGGRPAQRSAAAAGGSDKVGVFALALCFWVVLALRTNSCSKNRFGSRRIQAPIGGGSNGREALMGGGARSGCGISGGRGGPREQRLAVAAVGSDKVGIFAVAFCFWIALALHTNNCLPFLFIGFAFATDCT